jgi:tetratricopeptide (TPR) repeat protein
VLKLTPADALEHLSLARLQHTHIVPLHSVQDFPERQSRAICMPYFGGAALDRLLGAMRDTPPALRAGRDFAGVLARLQADQPLAPPPRGAAWDDLMRASYTRAVCWMGGCLADALQYAHERGILHLDLKPSNVLLTAEGLPMLLDFHVSRGPLAAGARSPHLFGGTPGYMSPEQEAAMIALEGGRPIPRAIDGRSDVYSLGVLLVEALGETNPEVSPGLADILSKCLASDPSRRYADMASLADDLRRHLADMPLRGVRNRSLGECWRKWRRRRPGGLAAAGVFAALAVVATSIGVGAFGHYAGRAEQARGALHAGRTELSEGRYAESAHTFGRGLALVRGVPLQGDLVEELERGRRAAEEARAEAEGVRLVRELHGLTDRLRFLCGVVSEPQGDARRLESACADLWRERETILARTAEARDDLLDLGILLADLIASKPGSNGRRAALAVLDEAEATLGPSATLAEERRRLADDTAGGPRRPVPDTAWGHTARGRSLLRSGDLAGAAGELDRAVQLQPHGLWPNFYLGVCAYRLGRHADAANAFSVCIGSAPDAAACYHNRAMAYAASGRPDAALRDYGHALRLDPAFAGAALNRAMLHHRERRHAAAEADFRLALRLGADPAVVHYDLALVDLARDDRPAAVANLRLAVGYRPGHEEAAKLLAELMRRR